MDVIAYALILFIGVVAGFFDSVVGAGGLISIPSLIFLGFQPNVAIATDRFGTIGQTVTAFFKFWKARQILWRYVPLLVGMAIGGYLGAHMALKKGNSWIKRLFVLFVIVSALKLLFF